MRLLSGVLPLWSGHVRFAGAELGRLSPDKRARLGLCQLGSENRVGEGESEERGGVVEK